MIVINNDEVVTFVNRAASQILDINQNDMMNQRILNVIPDSKLPDILISKNVKSINI